MIQRYDWSEFGYVECSYGDLCKSEDVAKMEDKYCKLLEAHMIMKEALEWLTTDACFLNCSHMSKREFAVKTLQRVAEVMP